MPCLFLWAVLVVRSNEKQPGAADAVLILSHPMPSDAVRRVHGVYVVPDCGLVVDGFHQNLLYVTSAFDTASGEHFTSYIDKDALQQQVVPHLCYLQH